MGSALSSSLSNPRPADPMMGDEEEAEEAREDAAFWLRVLHGDCGASAVDSAIDQLIEQAMQSPGGSQHQSPKRADAGDGDSWTVADLENILRQLEGAGHGTSPGLVNEVATGRSD